MAVYQQKEKKQYIAIPREILMDPNLSMKERGLLCTLYSFREDWHYSSEGLAKILCDGISAIKNTFRSLSRKGYVITKRNRSENGYFSEMELYLVLPKAMANSPPDGFPPMGNSPVETPLKDMPSDVNPPGEKRRQYNNHLSNNKKIIIKGFNRQDPSRSISKKYSAPSSQRRTLDITTFEKIMREQQNKQWAEKKDADKGSDTDHVRHITEKEKETDSFSQ